ncbi:MAG TPA: AAA family ATPase [Woeseiaceae bacterium]|nr:AAA family ATPase [Woeseiaceae bacterium]
MDQRHDLGLILRSGTPIVILETEDEPRMLGMLQEIVAGVSGKDDYQPLFRWTVTDGLQRLDIDLEPQKLNSEPTDILRHIRAVAKPGIYVLLDFHPFLDDPVHVRLLKDICIQHRDVRRQIVMISHRVDLPDELEPWAARVELALPDEQERRKIIQQVADEWSRDNEGSKVQADSRAYAMLVRNLAGLTYRDTERLAQNAIRLDGAITRSDIPAVMKAKYELLNRGGVLQFEYDTARFSQIGGLARLKRWLDQRRAPFRGDEDAQHLDAPKGLLLIGVQGCGKSLAAKAAAGAFGVPLLRLDLGAVYDKYHGETERKLRESLKTADIMAPCVLWLDEIEKGIAGRGGETGTTQRVLGSLLTWMAEKRSAVFVVATANDISALPPELVRKGRFDEIFFVDLPGEAVRREIFGIHLASRGQDAEGFELDALAGASAGFSGAEIEQAIVAALYAAHARKQPLNSMHISDELAQTQPLSVVMAEQVDGLRSWANGRTVPCD